MVISAEIQQAQTELLRRRAVSAETFSPASHSWLTPLHSPAKQTLPAPVRTIRKPTLRLMPDIAAGILRHELSAAGRVWLLLRANDSHGCGMITIDAARELLSSNASDWRVVGWRQLRNLLRDGAGTFWERDATHVWLRSQVKVAEALGIERFGRDAVEIEAANLFGSMHSVRSVLFAAVHAGRETPISRAALAEMTGICAESQRGYERVRAIRPKAQYAVLHNPSKETIWKQGGAGVEIIDSKGLHGKAGDKVLLRRLPNCYLSDAKTVKTRMKRRLNRKLGGLLNIGGAGNSWRKVERRYCTNGLHDGQYFRSGRDGVWYVKNEVPSPLL